MKGGLLTWFVRAVVFPLVIFFTVSTFVIGPKPTGTLAVTTMSALGNGFGDFLGSLGPFFTGVRTGQQNTGGTAFTAPAPVTPQKTTAPKAAPKKAPAGGSKVVPASKP